MGSGGGSQPANTTQTVTNQLPAYVQPYAETALQKGVALSQLPYQQYTGQQIAPLTPQHNLAVQGITQRAIQGSPVTNAANQNLTGTLQGNYLSPGANPWLDQTFNKGVEQIKATLSPKFGHMQAFGGSSGYNEALGRSTSDLAANLYGGNYQAERDRQIKGLALAPQIAGQDYADAQALLGAGDIQRQASQDELNLAYQQWLQQQQYPYQQLDVLSNAIRGAVGGGTQTTTAPNPYQPSPTASMLGGGLLGAGLAQSMGYNPGYGAAAGGILPWILG